MNAISNKRFKLVSLLLVVLLLRAAIPVGFMPAAAGSGLLVEFCPDGVSAEFIQFLLGDTEHKHADHGSSNDGGHQCPLGHMLFSAAVADDDSQPEDMAAVPPPITQVAYLFTSVSLTHYYSRGPPA